MKLRHVLPVVGAVLASQGVACQEIASVDRDKIAGAGGDEQTGGQGGAGGIETSGGGKNEGGMTGVGGSAGEGGTGGDECNPSPEICNGLDDNCDGYIDNLEGVGTVGDICMGIGECANGLLECDPNDPTILICDTLPGGSKDQSRPEVCDTLFDDDCDGVIDNGVCDFRQFILQGDPSCTAVLVFDAHSTLVASTTDGVCITGGFSSMVDNGDKIVILSGNDKIIYNSPKLADGNLPWTVKDTNFSNWPPTPPSVTVPSHQSLTTEFNNGGFSNGNIVVTPLGQGAHEVFDGNVAPGAQHFFYSGVLQ